MTIFDTMQASTSITVDNYVRDDPRRREYCPIRLLLQGPEYRKNPSSGTVGFVYRRKGALPIVRANPSGMCLCIPLEP